MVSLFRRGSAWWVTYQAGGRQFRRSLGTDNRRIALDLKAQVERRLLLGEPEAPEKRSLAEYLEEYRASSQARKRPRTHATDMARLADFVASLDRDCLGDVTTADVSRFLDRKVNRDGIGPTTVLRYREILHAFFQHARRLGYVRENPVSPIPRPRLAEREPAFLRQEQVEQVLKAVDGDRIHPLVATLIYAGLRREEACWLTKDDLDLAGITPVLRVRAKTVGGESWMPKTKRDRVVPVSPKLAATLRQLMPAKGPWLFTSPTGCRWDPDNLSRHWRARMDAAGLEVNFLMLRHTFGSRLAMKGVSLLKISKLTIGTRDGATIEMAQEAGEENFFLFGLNAEQVAASRGWYSPWWHYQNEPQTRAALDLIFSGHFSRDEPGVFEPLRATLLGAGDHYMHLADLKSYLDADDALTGLYSRADDWSRKAILNVAGSGKFSSDRTIAEYASSIWGAAPCAIH